MMEDFVEEEEIDFEIGYRPYSEIEKIGPVLKMDDLHKKDRDLEEAIDSRYKGISMIDQDIIFDMDIPHNSYAFMESINHNIGDKWVQDTFVSTTHLFSDEDDLALDNCNALTELKGIERLLDCSFKPLQNKVQDGKTKMAIMTPLMCSLNEFCESRVNVGISALVVGAGNGADIQRIWVARGYTSNKLHVDVVEPSASCQSSILAYRKKCGVPGDTFITHAHMMEVNKYDLILLTNVIHHFCHDKKGFMIRESLSRIKDALKPDGVILGMYPDFEGYCNTGSSIIFGENVNNYADKLELINVESDKGMYGIFNNITVGKFFSDAILPRDKLVMHCAQASLQCDIYDSRYVINRANMRIGKKWAHYKTITEHRGFAIFRMRHATDNLQTVYLADATFEEVSGSDIVFKVDPLSSVPNGKGLVCRYALNHGSILHHHELQFIMRSDNWYLSYKNNGVAGFGLILAKSSLMIFEDDPDRVYVCRGHGRNDVHTLHVQVEKVGKKVFLIELLAVNDKQPSSWFNGISVLYDMFRKTNYFSLKRWSKASPVAFKELCDSVDISIADGIVFQRRDSPPGFFISGKSFGHAQYYKSFPFRVTFDVHVEIVEFDEIISVPVVKGLSLGDVSGTYEVYSDNGMYVKVRYRPFKEPNTDRQLQLLSEAATYEEVITCLNVMTRRFVTHTVDLVKQSFYLKDYLALTKEERLELASTYPQKLHFFGKAISPKSIAAVYKYRLMCLQQLSRGLFDDFLLKVMRGAREKSSIRV